MPGADAFAHSPIALCVWVSFVVCLEAKLLLQAET
jgi:hypothetical protein